MTLLIALAFASAPFLGFALLLSRPPRRSSSAVLKKAVEDHDRALAQAVNEGLRLKAADKNLVRSQDDLSARVN